MTNSKELTELAERCEAATGPDRELDLAIELCFEGGQYDYPADNWQKDTLPYTASLDAAMTLAPEGKTVRLFIAPEATAAFINAIELAAMTPALALCAAALRARAATLTNEVDNDQQ